MKLEGIVRDFTCKRITTLDSEAKKAYLFKRDDARELLVVCYQSKGETPTEYRLCIDVPKSSRDDGYIEVYHFYRRR